MLLCCAGTFFLKYALLQTFNVEVYVGLTE
jgi:hypothetical protein